MFRFFKLARLKFESYKFTIPFYFRLAFYNKIEKGDAQPLYLEGSDGKPHPFLDYHENYVAPLIGAIEKRRIKTLRNLQFRTWLAIPVVLFLLGAIPLYWNEYGDNFLIYIAIFLFAAPYYFHFIHPILKFCALKFFTLSTRRFLKRGFEWALWVLIPAATAGILYLLRNPHLESSEGSLGLLLLLLIAWWLYQPQKWLKLHIKSEVYPPVFSYFGNRFMYQAIWKLHLMEIDDAGLLPHYHTSRCEDYIFGVHEEVPLQIAEVCLKRHVGIEKLRWTKTVFHGLFVTLRMNKPFNRPLSELYCAGKLACHCASQIRMYFFVHLRFCDARFAHFAHRSEFRKRSNGKTVLRKDKGGILNAMGKLVTMGMQTVRLEDSVFENKFEVYSTD